MTSAGPDSAVGAEALARASAEAYASKHYRHNVTLLIAEAGSFMLGLAFFDSSTVYPVLLAKLGASDALIGFARFIQTIGYTIPALFAAHYIHGRANHKSFLLATCAIARVGLFTIPVAIYLLADPHPTVALAWTMSVVGLFWLMDGATAVSWFDIVAKSVPARVRGRFFGTMQAVAGLLAMLAGLVVRQILESPEFAFPNGFALLAALWFAGAMGSQLGLAMLREPPGYSEPTDRRLGFTAYLRQAGPMLRRYPRVRHLILSRVLLDGAGLAVPFYVLFAQRDLRISLQMVGVYTIAQNAGRVTTGPVWGWLSDRFGASAGVRAVALSVLATPIVALTASQQSPWPMIAVFALMGATMDGIWMVMSTALLAAVDDRDRALAVGVASVCQTPSALYGPVGGIMAGLTSYRVVFCAATAFAAAGVLAACRLPSADAAHRLAAHEQETPQ